MGRLQGLAQTQIVDKKQQQPTLAVAAPADESEGASVEGGSDTMFDMEDTPDDPLPLTPCPDNAAFAPFRDLATQNNPTGTSRNFSSSSDPTTLARLSPEEIKKLVAKQVSRESRDIYGSRHRRKAKMSGRRDTASQCKDAF